MIWIVPIVPMWLAFILGDAAGALWMKLETRYG